MLQGRLDLQTRGTKQAEQPLGCAAKPDLSSWPAYLPTAVPFTPATEYKTGELNLVKKVAAMFTRTLDLGRFLTFGACSSEVFMLKVH